MPISVDIKGKIVVLQLDGDLHEQFFGPVGGIAALVKNLDRDKIHGVMLDFECVTAPTKRAVELLSELSASMKQKGQPLVILWPRIDVQGWLEAYDTQRKLLIADTREEALRLIDPPNH